MLSTPKSPARQLRQVHRGQVYLQQAHVTPRDVSILTWIGRHGIVTALQVARAFFKDEHGHVSQRAAYHRLQVLEEYGLLHREQTYWTGPNVRLLTPAGKRLCGVDIQPARVVWTELRHALAVIDLTEELLQQHPGSTLMTEREIKTERRRAVGRGAREIGIGRLPDGILILADGRRVAIELELADKDTERLKAILETYRRSKRADGYDGLWWMVRPNHVGRVRAAINQTHNDDWVEVRPWQPR